MASRGALQQVCACVALLGVFALQASACDIPVFRYALERWSPDPYEIIVFHQGAPAPDTEAVADLLAAGGLANTRLRPIDTSLPLPLDLRDLQEIASQRNAIAVRHVRTGELVWSGPVTSELPDGLLRSPARSTVAQRLLEGDSAVWLLLEVGNPQRDDAAAALLEEELELLEQTLTLPVEDLDLEISFSLLRVSRADPREEVLVRTLLGGEWDLAGTREPMAFPVFGRGRVLYALVGAGITRANIREACAFLTGPCACEIKDDNPGFDLLMAVDWTSGLGEFMSTTMLPSVAGLALADLGVAGLAAAVQDGGQEDSSAAIADPVEGNPLILNIGLAFLIGTVGILVASVFIYRVRR